MYNIELKKIKVFHPLSRETYCFTADLYINGHYAAHVMNDGHGGADDVYHRNIQGRELIHQAEGYFNSQPPEPLFLNAEKTIPLEAGGEQLMGKQSLESHINALITDHLTQQIIAKHNKKLATAMLTAIVVGIPNQEYVSYKFNLPIDAMCTGPVRQAALIKYIKELRATGKINATHQLLNTNIPSEIISQTL